MLCILHTLQASPLAAVQLRITTYCRFPRINRAPGLAPLKQLTVSHIHLRAYFHLMDLLLGPRRKHNS
jgi:hypothetical protein